MKMLILSLLVSVNAYAVEPQTYFLNAAGARIDASAALEAGLKGEAVVRCQAVEAKVNKSGTSISMRVVKKNQK